MSAAHTPKYFGPLLAGDLFSGNSQDTLRCSLKLIHTLVARKTSDHADGSWLVEGVGRARAQPLALLRIPGNVYTICVVNKLLVNIFTRMRSPLEGAIGYGFC